MFINQITQDTARPWPVLSKSMKKQLQSIRAGRRKMNKYRAHSSLFFDNEELEQQLKRMQK